MPEIKIKWLHDSYDCETCGLSYAEGAFVTLDENVLLDLEPAAHCFESNHWDCDTVYKLILEKIGHHVEDDEDAE